MKKLIIIFCLFCFSTGFLFSQGVSTSPSIIQPGGTITVSYTGAPGNTTDWIGLYPESAPSDRSWLTWQYTKGSKNGTMSFKAPDKPGRYNFRMFERDGYKLLATGNTIAVQTAPPPSTGSGLSNPDFVQPGQMITVNFSGAPGFTTDWIGLYPETAPSDRSWLSWKYTNGSKSGSLSFNAPEKTGRYNFRMFEKDGYKLLATGNTFTVQTSPPPPPPTTPSTQSGNVKISNPSSATTGQTVTVSFSGAPGNKTDWIGLYPESAPSDRSWLTWKYTDGVRSGQLTFNAPTKPGRYNFRLFENDGYRLLGTGNTIVVQ